MTLAPSPTESPLALPTIGPLFLGIDTGGTYTDAVLWSEAEEKILAKAKALTTRHDLAEGIAGAADAVLQKSGAPVSAIKLVSMSTTLATNALVEGQGGRAALVMIGFTPAEMARGGLQAALGGDPVIFCPGGHDVHGKASELDLGPLEAALPELAGTVTGFAVCGHFATRNAAHELAAAELIRAQTGLAVTRSHELTSKLGGPRRALTTLLNARLIGMIARLIDATQAYLTTRGIDAPLMVVRGDGALVSANFARNRPIETILSGPAASLVGARRLTGLADAMVSDIGGTTTDVALLDGGIPRLDPDGATVGGHRTMVEAVAMRTFGLGGDSEVTFDDAGLAPTIVLGPRRLAPLSMIGASHGEIVRRELERQLASPNPGRLDGRFALLSGAPAQAGLDAAETKLFEALSNEPRPLDRLILANPQLATLNRLTARGLALIAGFTPSDAAHVLGLQSNWDAEAARLGATLMARRRDGRGQPVAESPEAFSRRTLDRVTRRSAEAILETALVEDGLDSGLATHELVARALDSRSGVARFSLSLDRPVVGLGASAGLHYARLPELLGVACLTPDDADVANALGAVVGQVRVQAQAQVSQPQPGLFVVTSEALTRSFADEAAALAAAEADVRQRVNERALEAGAAEAEISVEIEFKSATVEGQRHFVEAVIIAIAAGRPRIA